DRERCERGLQAEQERVPGVLLAEGLDQVARGSVDKDRDDRQRQEREYAEQRQEQASAEGRTAHQPGGGLKPASLSALAPSPLSRPSMTSLAPSGFFAPVTTAAP